MAIISVTRLRLRSLWYLPGFILWARRTARQARKAEGNLGVGLLKDARLAFWTKTAWKDEDSMRLYKYSEPHRMVMPRITRWCDEAAVVHWTQEDAKLPDWKEAHRRLAEEGRKARLTHPSAAHQKFEIPLPKA